MWGKREGVWGKCAFCHGWETAKKAGGKKNIPLHSCDLATSNTSSVMVNLEEDSNPLPSDGKAAEESLTAQPNTGNTAY